MRRNRLATGIAVACVLAVIGARPAEALTGIQGDTSVSGGQVWAQASSVTASSPSGPAPSPGGSAQPDPCFYYPVDPATAASLGPGGPGPGAWYFPTCGPDLFAVGLSVAPAPVWFPAGQAPAAVPSVPGLMNQARSATALIQPSVVMNPPGDQMVNFATWLAIPASEWHPVSATAKAGGVTATVTAAPSAVDWNMGDGDTLTCHGPGVIYDPNEPASSQSTYCSYVWPRSSANQPNGTFAVTATIVYSVTSTVTGAPNPTPALGNAAGPAVTQAVAVAQVEALGTGPN